MELFVKIIFAKSSILDVWQGSEYAPKSDVKKNWDSIYYIKIEKKWVRDNVLDGI